MEPQKARRRRRSKMQIKLIKVWNQYQKRIKKIKSRGQCLIEA
jgi:hypothetical protein